MLKVAVIGGGSTYTPELVNGFLARWINSRSMNSG
jgi:alpha-galactosidase/6-phospho-beta-glucosidase family protein